MGVPTWMSIYNDLKGYGVDEKRAKSIANEFVDSNGNLIYFNNPGQRKYNGTTMSEAVRNAAQGVMRGGSKAKGGQSKQGHGEIPVAGVWCADDDNFIVGRVVCRELG